MILPISAILLLPLAVYATSTQPVRTTQGTPTRTALPSKETAPFTPGTPGDKPYDVCTSETIEIKQGKNIGSWIDCLELGQWAQDNIGMWIVKTTNDRTNPTDWTSLYQTGDCALVVQNESPTNVGNRDVDVLIRDIFFQAGTHMGSIEAKGNLTCTGGVTLAWWLRGT